MKNKKFMWALVVGVSIFTLAGCSTPNDTDTNGARETKDTYIENNLTDPDQKDISDGNDSKDISDGNDSKDISDGNDSRDTSHGNDVNAVGSMDGGELIAASDLQGSVIEFTDNGCTINPVTNSDDGSTAAIAAEGYEDEGAKVNIKYGDNCIFQRAVISIATGKAAVSEVTISDIKKKTSLLLYGNFDDTENFTAAKVVIVQYEQEE